jgi:prophage regulatory protein
MSKNCPIRNIGAISPVFLTREMLPGHVGLSISTIEEEIRHERFPRPRQLSARRVAWLARELEEWAEGRPISDLACPPNTAALKPKLRAPTGG